MPTPSLHDLSYNRLFHAMPEAERCRLQPELTWTAPPLGQSLSAPGDPLSIVHFPTTAIVSLVSVMEDGASVEAAAVGPKGVVGARHEGVTAGALRLQRAGLIRYRRGHISVLDRSSLERRSCERHAVMTAICRPVMTEATLQASGAAR